jgi:hypothetical protein
MSPKRFTPGRPLVSNFQTVISQSAVVANIYFRESRGKFLNLALASSTDASSSIDALRIIDALSTIYASTCV